MEYQRLSPYDGDRQLDFHLLTLTNGRHGRRRTLGDWARLYLTEGLLQQGDERAVGRDVTAENQAHVRGHIVFLVEGIHVAQSRVLQVVGGADDRLSIGVVLEQHLQCFLHSITQLIGRAVLLLIHILQLSLESAEHGVYQSFRVQPAPLCHELWQEGVVIEGHVIARAGIQARAAIA